MEIYHAIRGNFHWEPSPNGKFPVVLAVAWIVHFLNMVTLFDFTEFGINFRRSNQILLVCLGLLTASPFLYKKRKVIHLFVFLLAYRFYWLIAIEMAMRHNWEFRLSESVIVISSVVLVSEFIVYDSYFEERP